MAQTDRTDDPSRRVAPAPHPMLEEIERSVALPPGVTGAGALTAVMCTLFHRLTRCEARQVVMNLPPGLRPFFYDCLTQRGEEPVRFHRTALLARIARTLKTESAEPIACAVFRAVRAYLPTDVVEHVKSRLPPDLKDLWAPAAVTSGAHHVGT